MRKKRRNPLLVDVYATVHALGRFTNCVHKCKTEILQMEVSRVRVI